MGRFVVLLFLGFILTITGCGIPKMEEAGKSSLPPGCVSGKSLKSFPALSGSITWTPNNTEKLVEEIEEEIEATTGEIVAPTPTVNAKLPEEQP